MTTQPLVTTQWLHDHLDDKNIIILDGTYSMPGSGLTAFERYQKHHIPEAGFFDIDEIADQFSSLPHMLPTAEEFSKAVQQLGITPKHHIIVYDQYGLFSAARVWWMFRVFGHDAVSVLDGGLLKWHSEGRPLTKSLQKLSPSDSFKATLRPKLVKNYQQILDELDHQKEYLIDARSPDRFAGQMSEPRPGLRSGHIPTSKNIFFMDLINNQTGCLKPKDELAQIFAQHKIDLAQPTTTYCGSGVTACIVALAAYILGHRNMAIYDGSWTEWGARSDLPIATGRL